MLEIALCHVSWSMLDAFEVHGPTSKPTSIRLIWFKAFLDRHKYSLKHMRLEGILISYEHTLPDTACAMLTILEMLQKLSLNSVA